MSMAPVDELSLLKVLERGLDQPAYKRALLLLEAVQPGVNGEGLAAMPIGQRDRCLLLLREQLFGSRMECTLACPNCGEALEFSCSVTDLCLEPALPHDQHLELLHGDIAVRYRLPNSDDLATALQDNPESNGQAAVLERCIQLVTDNDRDITGQPLPVEIQAAVLEGMESADPQGNVELDMTCPSCAEQWQSPFDIVAYLWSELEAWGQRLLGDIHALASSYGWTEAEVLAVTPWRRRQYLERLARLRVDR
ncbi:MAG: phage baseplate protein [Pseudomonadota bacterium]